MRQIMLVGLIVAGCASDDEMMGLGYPDYCTGASANITFPADGAVVPPGVVDVRVEWHPGAHDPYANVRGDGEPFLLGEDVHDYAVVVSHWAGLAANGSFSIDAGWYCFNDNNTRYMTVSVATSHFSTSAM